MKRPNIVKMDFAHIWGVELVNESCDPIWLKGDQELGFHPLWLQFLPFLLFTLKIGATVEIRP